MQHFLSKIFILVWKDLLIDYRRKDNLPSMLLFLVTALLIFQFAIGIETKIFLRFLPSILWVIFLMTGVLGLGKSYIQEIESGCIGGLLTVPVDRSVLFIGKMLGNTLILFISLIIFIPSVVILYGIELKNWVELFLLLLFGTVGLSSLGTLLTALTATLRGKEILLPILIFPLMIPGLLCVVHITDALFFALNSEDAWKWWKLLVGFDVVIFTISLLGFEFVVEE